MHRLRPLRYAALLAALVLFTAGQIQEPQRGPDERYWDYDEVLAQLAQWEMQYPDIFHREVIGYTGEFNEAIWAVKISDNAGMREPECRVLIGAAVHANESNGVGAIMYMCDRLLTRYGQVSYYTEMVDGLEIWFVPVFNIDGYRHVFEGGDNWDWWRKSMRDNNGDHQYTFPIDGVDCNRNWDYRWAEYDSTAWTSSRYKGPYPWSEACVVAFRDLVLRERPVIVQSLHSPDVPTIGNKNWWPWYDPQTFQNGPDDDIYRPISQTLGSRTETEVSGTYVNGSGACYNVLPKEQCWIYANTGICAFLMEISRQYWWTGAMVDTIAARFGRGNLYLLEKALEGPGLTGTVTASHTGMPVQAEIVVSQVHDPDIGPRLTDDVFGQYWRFLLPGSYTVTASADNFYSDTQSIYVGSTGWTQLDFELDPEPGAVAGGEAAARTRVWFDTPMRSGGAVHFRLDDAGEVALDLLDVSGRVVKRLVAGRFEAGEHRVTLTGSVASGSYLVHMRAPGAELSRKVLVVE